MQQAHLPEADLAFRAWLAEAAAARLLGVAQSTLNYWLEGGERRGKLCTRSWKHSASRGRPAKESGRAARRAKGAR